MQAYSSRLVLVRLARAFGQVIFGTQMVHIALAMEVHVHLHYCICACRRLSGHLHQPNTVKLRQVSPWLLLLDMLPQHQCSNMVLL